MSRQRSTLLIPVFAAIALASACQSDDAETPTGASGMAAGGASHAGTGGVVSGAGSAGRAGSDAPVSGGSAGTGAAGAPSMAGGAGADDGSAQGGVSGDSGSPGDAGSAGSGGSAGDSSDSGDGVQRYAYVATFLSGLLPVSIDPVSGRPTKLGSTINPGAQLYAVSVDSAHHHLYTAEQGTKKINSYAIAADGSLPAQPTSTTTIAGRPTSLTLDVRGRFAYVASSDEDKSIYTFEIDATSGALTAVGEPLALEATSPAYVAADPSGQFVYASQNGAFGIRAYRVDQNTGALSELPGSPFGLTQVFAGAIAFHPAGGWLFSAGNGLNAFAIDAVSGALTRVEGSPFSTQVASDPSATNLAVEPRGKYLYATSFLNPPRVFGFEIDSSSGKLTAVPGEPIKGGSPYSLGVEPSGRFVFAGNDDGTTSVFSLLRANGTLHEIDGSPFPIGGLQPELAFASAH